MSRKNTNQPEYGTGLPHPSRVLGGRVGRADFDLANARQPNAFPIDPGDATTTLSAFGRKHPQTRIPDVHLNLAVPDPNP